tara:strand:- start:410 stop:664 length:255 start_codon:yes stop_codon:yes gene_type:complete
MTKYRVKKRMQLLYPDGSPRGGPGYVVDGSAGSERETFADQGDVLEPLRERSAVPSPVDLSLLVPQPVTKPKAKKKAKKKAAKK